MLLLLILGGTGWAEIPDAMICLHLLLERTNRDPERCVELPVASRYIKGPWCPLPLLGCGRPLRGLQFVAGGEGEAVLLNV